MAPIFCREMLSAFPCRDTQRSLLLINDILRLFQWNEKCSILGQVLQKVQAETKA